jgi:nucleolar protein 14
VSENFFGGFDSNGKPSKNDNDDNRGDDAGQKKNRKEWVEEMIVKSKQAKYERQKERDKTLDLTELLDKEWKQIQPVINVMIKKNKIEEDKKIEEEKKNPPKQKPDDYDVLVRSFQFDEKAKVKPNFETVQLLLIILTKFNFKN